MIRAESEKIRLCTMYLKKHGYMVARAMMTSKEVADVLGVSVTHVLSLIKSEGFPSPYLIGINNNSPGVRKLYRFKSEEIETWLESRRAAKQEELQCEE